MIVDGHAHAFPYLGGASGFPSAEDHVRALQRHFTTHPQGARRVSDNQLVTEPTLWDGKTPGFAGLLDVNFRVGKFGRFEWENDGVAYYIQWLPPHLEDNEARPERMLAQMQYVGVDRAMLQRGRMYGFVDEYLGEIVRRYPDKLRGCLAVEESELNDERQIEHLRRCVLDLGLTALYFDNDTFWSGARGADFGAPPYVPFWEAVEALGIPVLWDIRFPQRRTHADYLGEVARLHRFVRQFPRIRSVLTHGLPAHAFADGRLPDEVVALLREPNLTLELLFPLLYGATWDYPYAEARPIIRELYAKLGASKLLWGSDMPNVERSCTYRQSLTYLSRYCDFIPSGYLDGIVGANADELYFSLAPRFA
ncbi:MAG: amidohydrolase [Chloroflexota bacterium]|nr:amidohydrolase [Chloroflexota bacterium]